MQARMHISYCITVMHAQNIQNIINVLIRNRNDFIT